MTHRSSRLRAAGEVALIVSVLLTALLVFFTAKVKLSSDEVNVIGTSRYFETFFVERDFSDEAWADSHLTRTQPMIFRYVVGSWLWLRGHDLRAQNPNYDYSKPVEANRRLGLTPASDVLNDARMPARLMAALAVTVLYLLVRMLAGPVGGLAATTSAVGSPYLQEMLIRAKSESTLMFFLLAALLLSIVGTSRIRRPWSACRWGGGTGLLLGLALGSKLTAALAVIALALWAASALLHARLHPGRGHAYGGLWALVMLVTVAIVFIGSNPFTWPDPIGRSWVLFENRRDEMAQQQLDVPSRAVHSLDRRISLVWERSVWNDAFSPSRLNLPLEAILAIVGGVWLAIRVLILKAARRHTGESMLLLWVIVLWVGITVALGFLLRQYFVPTAMIAILLSGLAIGWSTQAAWGFVTRMLGTSSLSTADLQADSPSQ